MSGTVAGQRWFGTSSTVELIVVKGGEADLSCGGSPMVLERPADSTGSTDATGDGTPVLVGKRYVDDASGILVLVTKEGTGPLTADGRVLVEQQTQPLPSSD